ncbi:vascular endothelial growth factor A isoform X2 [Notechis scutatus]|uniref:Vascular endothelial growth factor A n=1 Tax=Notechis scutatus TaxID=8663 RepID=A0A6J1V2C1_9SAUR|nr:vascular endothelial growth factor A isoform X2 [Notechis scutatus]
MNFLLTWIHCGLAALLYFHNAKVLQAAPAQEDGEKQPEEVIPFMTVFERSACRPIETMVDIYQEYPDEVEYMFKPSCVLLMKCGGFCNDEALECVPTEVYNVSMEIMKLRHLQSQHIQLMSFQQHSKCQCRQKKPIRIKQENHCEPCSERRKHLYKQDPLTCKCSCKFTDSRCKSKQLELNERTCRCDKPRR